MIIKHALCLIFSLFIHLSLASGEEVSFVQNGEYYTHPSFQEKANIRDNSLYEHSHKDFLDFWNSCAQEISWFCPWSTVLSWDPPYARWFEEGELNACYNCLDRHLERGNKVALICCNENGQTKQVTYAELYDEVCRLANALKSLGIKKGDRVAIYMPMVSEAVASMLACARIGAVHSVVFGGIGSGSLKEKIVDAEAKVLITSDGSYRKGKLICYKQIADEILPECLSIKNVIVLKNADNPIPLKSNRDRWYHELVSNASPSCPCEPMKSEDLLFILYTSGTTGKAKGILHTTGGYMVGVHNTFKWVFDIKPNDIYWCTADVGWITGHSYVVYGPMSNGVTQIIYDGSPDFPSRDRLWKIVEEQKATIFYTAPTLIRTLMKWGPDWIAKHDTSSLRLLGSIGEPLNPEAWQWFHKHVGQEKCPIVDTWFQTETGAFVIAPIPGLTPLKPGSVSKALPGMQINVFNDSGEVNNIGYLAITAPFPSMLRGIFKDPQRYYDAYWKKWNGKYYFAGDSASKDADGYLWVQGRADEVIKSSGHRVGTAEIENALIQHTSVSESAVIGVKDDLKGQAIIALVVLKNNCQGGPTLEQDLKRLVSKQMGSYATPEVIAFISDLPKTRSGKILRRLIRNLVDGEPVGDITTLENKGILEELTLVCKKVHETLRNNRGS